MVQSRKTQKRALLLKKMLELDRKCLLFLASEAAPIGLRSTYFLFFCFVFAFSKSFFNLQKSDYCNLGHQDTPIPFLRWDLNTGSRQLATIQVTHKDDRDQDKEKLWAFKLFIHVYITYQCHFNILRFLECYILTLIF